MIVPHSLQRSPAMLAMAFLWFCLPVQADDTPGHEWIDISHCLNAITDGGDLIHYSDLHFVSRHGGWVNSSTQPQIYHTVDGGKSWEVQPIGSTIEAIHMIDAVAVCACWNLATLLKRIPHSTDLQSWQPLGVPAPTCTEAYLCDRVDSEPEGAP